MLDNETKRRIDTARDILVGKVPDPKSQVEQITISLIYKFMDDMDAEAEELGGKRKFFSGDFERFGWKKLMAPNLGGFEVINLYAEAIQKMNINPNIPQLFRDIFKNAFLPYRDPETLKSFLKTIDDFEYDHSERLGDAFEYLLSVLGSQGEAGQFRTPRHIIDFMVDIIDPKKDNNILDPACGTAGFLISSYKHILKHNSSNFVPEKDKEAFEQTDVSIAELTSGGIIKYKGDKLTPDERAKLSKNIKGYDISPDMVRLSLVNLYLHGFIDPKIQEYDTLTSEDNWNEYADIILANPPFMSPKGGIKPHKRFSIPSNRSEVLFVDYIVEHLTPNGKAAVIVPEGVIFQSGTAYKQLRKMLVENYLFAVVSLPAGVFNPYSGVKTSILLMDKTLNKKTDKILFVKIENDGFDLGAQRRPKSGSQLPISAALIKEYITASYSGIDQESILTDKFGPNYLWNITTKEKIAENDDWNLSGERYKKILTKITKYKTVALSSICKVYNGRAFKQEELLDSGKYMVLRVGNFFSSKDWYYSDLELDEDKYCDNGDLLYAWSASFGPKIWNGGKVIYHYHIWKMVPDESLINKMFLYHILEYETEEIKAEGGRGIAMIHITKQGIEQRQIPLPPLEIQKEIVAEIEGWQKIIDGARQVVENYKPQIDIDPEWKSNELQNVDVEIIDGDRGVNYPSKEEFTSEGYCVFLNTKNVLKDGFNFEEVSFITKEKDEKLRKGKIKRNDIVITTRGTVGNIAIYDKSIPYENIRINSGMLIFRPDEKIFNPFYIFWYFQSQSIQDKLKNISSGSAQPQLPIRDLKHLKISIPEKSIQYEIVKQLEKEKDYIQSNKEIISIFEQKIKDKIAKVWGE
jgi:type I restriction enzyme M protein